MNIYSDFISEENACVWYRVEQPLKWINLLGLARVHVNKHLTSMDIERMVSRDEPFARWTYSGYGDDVLGWKGDINNSRRRYSKDDFGRVDIVYDVDEDLFNAYSDVGSVGLAATMPAYKRRLFISKHKSAIENASLVTCATKRLEDSVVEHVPGARTFVFPNCLDVSQCYKIKHADTNSVRILWYGSISHSACLQSVVNVLKCIHDEYRQVKIILWGEFDKSHFSEFERIEYLEPVNFSKFFLMLNSIGHDIVLAPLVPSAFNISRGASKFYESAFCSKPAVCVASRFGVFADEIADRVTGVLYGSEEEHYHVLSEIICNYDLRSRIAEGGKRWCVAHRSCESNVRELYARIDRKVQ